MGLLKDSFYSDLMNQADYPGSMPTQTPAPTSSVSTPPVASQSDFSRGGGFKFFAYNVGNALGLGLPEEQEFKQMSFMQKSKEVVKGMGRVALRTVAAVPEEIIKPFVAVPATVYRGGKNVVTGKPFSTPEEKPITFTGLGEIPTWFKTYNDAVKSGMGPLAATFLTTGKAAGDVSIVGSALTGAVRSSFAPRGKLVPGETVTNTAPIKQLILEDAGKLSIGKKFETANEYYPLTDTVAKQYGGTKQNTVFKFAPTADGGVEVSVMRIGKNIKGGQQSDYAGFQEVKLDSWMARAAGPAATIEEKFFSAISARESSGRYNVSHKVTASGDVALGKYGIMNSNLPQWSTEAVGRQVSRSEFLRNPALQDKIARYQLAKILRKHNGNVDEAASEWFSGPGRYQDKKAFKDANGVTVEQYVNDIKNLMASNQKQITIPTAPLKGFENKPITPAQVGQISLISEVNGIKPEVMNTIVNAVTGKTNVGSLTQAEFVNVAQASALLSKAEQYSPSVGYINQAAKYLSPRNNLFRSIEERTGYPVASKVEIPIENAARLAKISDETWFNRLDEIYGEYASPKYAEERSLIGSYLRGNKEAISANEAIAPQMKAALTEIAEKHRALLNELGPALNVPSDVMIENYLSNIRNIGGTYQLYKEGSDIPAGLQFFAKEKRTGGLTPVLDDPYGITQIYIKAGGKAKFMGPAIEQAAAVAKDLPATVQSSVRAYVLEKLGYAGGMEKGLDDAITALNQKMGWNLPPDSARRITQFIMDTSYSGAMGLRPGVYVRNVISNPVFAYVDRGPEFYASAVQKALTKEGIAEVRAKGFLVDLGNPYGEAVTDLSPITNIGNKYRKVTQGLLKGQEVTDTFGRTVVYHQTKMQFDDAVSAYNAGKIRWEQVEKKLDLDGMSAVDRNEIRQRLVSGDIDGAREHLIRVVLDNTQFPYRRGTAMALTDGMFGKIVGQFSQWTNQYVHMVGRMVKYKQYDKMVRFYAANAVVLRSMKEGFGLDYSRSVGLNPAFPSLPPAVDTSLNIYEGIKAAFDRNAEEVDKNKDEIAQTLKQLGMPAGVQTQSWMSFWNSYNKGVLQDGSGQYGVYDSRGRLVRRATFSELFWEMWGFPTESKANEKRLNRDMSNSRYNYSQAKQEALQLLNEGKNDEANAIINKYGIRLDKNDFLQFDVPRIERNFETLPSTLKGEFGPKIYP